MFESDDILTIIDENRCWTCKCELEDRDSCTFKYVCPECNEEYYSCISCEKSNRGLPVSVDCETIDKGVICNKCHNHYCIAHWQNMKRCVIEFSDFICEHCMPRHRKKGVVYRPKKRISKKVY